MTTKHPVSGIKYHPNVAAILRRADGRIFIGERYSIAGAWQFPQGGVDEGESHDEALQRELWEETGVQPHDYRVLEKRGPYHYLYPPGMTKRGYQGKQQWYFLCDFHGPDSHINISAKDLEFRTWRWIAPGDFSLAWLPPMKRDVYREVFADFFSINLAIPQESD